MHKLFIFLFFLVLISCSQKYYVVRHAEKEASPQNPRDPGLSAEGLARAQILKNILKKKNIKQIYSTATTRTMQTAAPLAELLNIRIETYGPVPDISFIERLKAAKENILILGHSNTIDEIVNGLSSSSELSDLPESIYGNIYVVSRKGDNYKVKRIEY